MVKTVQDALLHFINRLDLSDCKSSWTDLLSSILHFNMDINYILSPAVTASPSFSKSSFTYEQTLKYLQTKHT